MIAPVILLESNDETMHFQVRSSSRNETHDIYFDIDHGFVCTCEQYYYRKVECKHIRQVKEYMAEMNNRLQHAPVYEEIRGEL